MNSQTLCTVLVQYNGITLSYSYPTVFVFVHLLSFITRKTYTGAYSVETNNQPHILQ